MSIFLDISAALDGQLNTMVGVPPVAWENRQYDPANGTLYVRPTLISGDVTQATLGTSGTDSNIGIYQIDVFSENGKGKNEAIVMADTIADRFKRGTQLTYNGRVVRVRDVSRQVGINNNDGWYMLSVDVSYIAYTSARV